MGDAEKRELASVIDSGWFTEAKKTREFEKMFSNFIGSKYSCAVTSGTAGLYLALKAVGIGSGDEVIVPALTFIASPNSIEATGAKPILIDIESQSLNLNMYNLHICVGQGTTFIAIKYIAKLKRYKTYR